ncbi:GNAT family N-acetyltransferase [Sphingorhabdus lutea]|uniref:GNAT family N-acetyltransferase n=1 Tax=Sphingorhabdus lutea TaxID=1913578 RepID=A0A1L3J9L3_9SPHN|nr:GNAT family N-acetyltransferase [Sphingorhabdus lutea]APG61801.1 GNAT family N-acetyltransferase [Sphingorhabdus lutea]
MRIIADDLSGVEIRALLELHFASMLANSPKGSCHFLDFDGLNGDDVTFWSIWDDSQNEPKLAGCGALKEIAPHHGEVKSMRTHPDYLRRGASQAMLSHIFIEAQRRGYERLSLETGSGEAFEPAIQLYQKNGFIFCPPFAQYVDDPFSRFMSKKI